MRSNAQIYNLGINTDCFRALDKIERSKVIRTRKGENTNQPRSNYGRVMWEIAMRAYQDEQDDPSLPPADPSWGLYARPTVMCHNARGGVEYQEEMVKYFGSAMPK